MCQLCGTRIVFKETGQRLMQGHKTLSGERRNPKHTRMYWELPSDFHCLVVQLFATVYTGEYLEQLRKTLPAYFKRPVWRRRWLKERGASSLAMYKSKKKTA